jgi:hypothetical protein
MLPRAVDLLGGLDFIGDARETRAAEAQCVERPAASIDYESAGGRSHGGHGQSERSRRSGGGRWIGNHPASHVRQPDEYGHASRSGSGRGPRPGAWKMNPG